MRAPVTWATIVLLFSLTAAPVFAADATTSPGKTSVFVAHQSSGYADICCQVKLNATINRGRRHEVLRIDGTFKAVNTFGCSPTDVDMFPPQVNGIIVNPDALGGWISAVAHCDPSVHVCPTITGTYWLDLDAAEAANPGMFIGKPLNITLLGEWFGVNCGIFDSLTMSAVTVSKTGK